MTQVEDMEWLVDAFHGGELTALEDAEAVLGKLTGYQVGGDMELRYILAGLLVRYHSHEVHHQPIMIHHW